MMMRFLFLLAFCGLLAACGGDKFRDYEGPAVTQVVVFKGERRLLLMGGDQVLHRYQVGLGFQPQGHKQMEGDGRTPEGFYFIDKRNPESAYHLSIGISYPNHFDEAMAEELGAEPGGDIFIHGRGPLYPANALQDWTAGCIAVTDNEIEKIYAMVPNGTPITIFP